MSRRAREQAERVADSVSTAQAGASRDLGRAAELARRGDFVSMLRNLDSPAVVTEMGVHTVAVLHAAVRLGLCEDPSTGLDVLRADTRHALEMRYLDDVVVGPLAAAREARLRQIADPRTNTDMLLWLDETVSAYEADPASVPPAALAEIRGALPDVVMTAVDRFVAAAGAAIGPRKSGRTWVKTVGPRVGAVAAGGLLLAAPHLGFGPDVLEAISTVATASGLAAIGTWEITKSTLRILRDTAAVQTDALAALRASEPELVAARETEWRNAGADQPGSLSGLHGRVVRIAVGRAPQREPAPLIPR